VGLLNNSLLQNGSSQVFLDSETSYRNPKNLGVVVTESGRVNDPGQIEMVG
jgi:hypothetical protein